MLTALLCSGVSVAAAQTRPFLYSLAPATGQAVRAGVYSELAFGHNLFASLGPEELEQRMSLQLPITTRIAFAGQAGWVPTSTENDAAVQGEILADFTPRHARVILAAGVGGMADYDHTPGVLGRLVAGYRWASTLAVANVRFEHAFPPSDASLAKQRDALDIVSTFGVSHQATAHMRVGVESVAEDLEGLVESDEVEGGAKLMLGPSIGLGPRDARWNAQIIAGAVTHLTQSSVSGIGSTAPRDLTGTGYVVRAAFGMQW